MPNDSKGFISFEGIDGAGKSTQAKLLADHLAQKGIECVLTREPGGSTGAEEIRELLVSGDPGRWSPETEILLFTAARRDHLERTILPALDDGKLVITDRFADSTRIYQGVVRSELGETVNALHDLMIQKDPDLTIIIDMDPDVSLSRGLARGNSEERFEKFGADFQHQLKRGFLNLAKNNPERCKVVDGNRSPHDVAEDVAKMVDAFLNG